MRPQRKQQFVTIVSLTLLALAVRVALLPVIPPGILRDEAFNGVDVLDILNGQRPIYLERNLGREPLFIYLQAISVAILGPSPFALRLVAAIMGALTVPAVYWMICEAFAGSKVPARWLAFWSSLFLALSYWHINFSRMGFRAITFPLMAAIVFAWFWRAWWRLERGGAFPWTDLVLCGVCVGISLYTYLAARFVPVLLVLVASVGMILNRRQPGFARRATLSVVLIGGVATVVFAPLGLYFVAHPQSFIGHAASLSIFNPALNQGMPLYSALHNIVQTAGMFVAPGDLNPTHNPAGRGVIDPLLLAWLVAGVVVAIIATVRCRSLPHFFALAWPVVFALPALLALENPPHALRALGMVPGVCLLAVLAMASGRDFLLGHPAWWTGGRQWLAALLPLPFLLFSGYTSLHDYFGVWGSSKAPEVAFDPGFPRLLQTLFAQQTGAEGAWIVPISPIFYATSTIDFTLSYTHQGESGYKAVSAGVATAPTALDKLAQGRKYGYLVEWRKPDLYWDGSYAYADPKHLLGFLLEKYGRKVATSPGDSLGYSTYELPATPDYSVATHIDPIDVSFGGKVRLTGLGYGRTASGPTDSTASLAETSLPAGHAAWAVLNWRAQAPVDYDLKASLRLVSESGHLAGQVDDLLVSDRYPFSRTWTIGEAAATYHILPVLAGVPPGAYRLMLSVYDSRSSLSLPVVRQDGSMGPLEAEIGSLEVARPLDSPVVKPENTLPAGTQLCPELALLGYDLPGRSASPGDVLPVTLYWRAASRPAVDYLAELALQDAQGRTVVTSQGPPGGRLFPTSSWEEGDALRDWHDLALAPDTPSGKYRLVASLREGARIVGQAQLGDVEVTAQTRTFQAPAIQHPMSATLGSQVGFLGYDLDAAALAPGSPLTVTLYWRSRAAIDRPYTVFVHVIGPDGRAWGQRDNYPVGGTRPTTGWIVGEYLDDPYRVTISPDAPPGSYRVEIGMYDATTGFRLPVTTPDGAPASDRILLSEAIEVKP